MRQDPLSDKDSTSTSRAPLFSIGLTVGAVLLVPIFLFSVGPDGPIRVGDVVFSSARHRVSFLHPLGQGRDTCVLEERVQLVIQKTDVMPQNTMIAEVIGVNDSGTPYCPPRTPVHIHTRQVTLKANFWGRLKDAFFQMFAT